MSAQTKLPLEGLANCTPRRKIQAFYDYSSYIAKFGDAPKTTDDTYTPEDVYMCLLEWLDPYIAGARVVRPFYPQGDYQSEEYPQGCVVIDNPPFSRCGEIVRWYVAREIPFFLFCNGLTAFDLISYATIVVVGGDMRFENGAKLCVNFVSNLFGDIACMTAPTLRSLFDECESQAKRDQKVRTKISWPPNILGINDMAKLAQGGVDLAISRGDYRVFKPQPGFSPFGNRLLIRSETATQIRDELARIEDGKTRKVQLDSYNLAQLAEIEEDE